MRLSMAERRGLVRLSCRLKKTTHFSLHGARWRGAWPSKWFSSGQVAAPYHAATGHSEQFCQLLHGLAVPAPARPCGSASLSQESLTLARSASTVQQSRSVFVTILYYEYARGSAGGEHAYRSSGLLGRCRSRQGQEDDPRYHRRHGGLGCSRACRRSHRPRNPKDTLGCWRPSSL